MASPHPVSITLTTTAGLTGPMTREKAETLAREMAEVIEVNMAAAYPQAAIRAEASTVLRSREGMA